MAIIFIFFLILFSFLIEVFLLIVTFSLSTSSYQLDDSIVQISMSGLLSFCLIPNVLPIGHHPELIRGFHSSSSINPLRFTSNTTKPKPLSAIYLTTKKGESDSLVPDTLFITDPKGTHTINSPNVFEQYFNKMKLWHPDKSVVFCHDLGNLTGYFLYKELLLKYPPELVTCALDADHNFVWIIYKDKDYRITWLDSSRLFPVVLELLGPSLGVESNMEKPSLYLYDCLKTAQKQYLFDYRVDICSVVSATSLALKIFRKNYMKHQIPTLKGYADSYIRDSYFGGATDFYEAMADKLHYWDVNSLYASAMKKPMPDKLIRFHEELDSLDGFYGFCLVEVNCPKNIRPMLPLRTDDHTIYPTGKWMGVYYSEECKEMVKLGYTIKTINGYEFSKRVFFDEYVDTIFKVKKNSTGAIRFIAKMLLNSLYGYFGRKTKLFTTIAVSTSNLEAYLAAYEVKSIVDIGNNTTLLLVSPDVNTNKLSKLNATLTLKDKPFEMNIKSNVAIASAITAEARIEMIKYKILKETVYTDTDSVLTRNLNMPKEWIGDGLGQLKSAIEDKSEFISKACFIDIKKYG